MAAVIGSLAVVLGGAIIAINLSSERQAQKPVAEQAPQQQPQAAVAAAAATGGDRAAAVADACSINTGRSAAGRRKEGSRGGRMAAARDLSGSVRTSPAAIRILRSGPAVKYKIVIPIPAGATGIELGACRAAEDNTRPWCQATWRGLSGWISSCCIVDEKTGAPPKVD